MFRKNLSLAAVVFFVFSLIVLSLMPSAQAAVKTINAKKFKPAGEGDFVKVLQLMKIKTFESLHLLDDSDVPGLLITYRNEDGKFKIVYSVTYTPKLTPEENRQLWETEEMLWDVTGCQDPSTGNFNLYYPYKRGKQAVLDRKNYDSGLNIFDTINLATKKSPGEFDNIVFDSSIRYDNYLESQLPPPFEFCIFCSNYTYGSEDKCNGYCVTWYPSELRREIHSIQMSKIADTQKVLEAHCLRSSEGQTSFDSFDFILEIQVKSHGFMPEYGAALMGGK